MQPKSGIKDTDAKMLNVRLQIAVSLTIKTRNFPHNKGLERLLGCERDEDRIAFVAAGCDAPPSSSRAARAHQIGVWGLGI